MEHQSAETPPPSLPAIREVSIRDPFRWLSAGWQDYKQTGFQASLYGVLFALMGYIVVWMYATRWQLTMGLISGFFLMGPFICTGIYGLSRQLQRGESVSLVSSLTCWRQNPGAIGFFAILVTFAMIVWARVSLILFALFSTTSFPTLSGVLQVVFSTQNLPFLLAWVGVGFIFASLVFAISVVSVPMMLDRDIDTLSAVFTSARTLLVNPVPLYAWAVLVVAIIGTSLLLGFIPLIVTAPLVGHGTWHAYRALVAEPDR